MIAELLNRIADSAHILIFMFAISVAVEMRRGERFFTAFKKTIYQIPLLVLVFLVMEVLIFGPIIFGQHFAI